MREATLARDKVDFLHFRDTKDLYQLHLSQQTLDALEFELTDVKGRPLSELSPRQADAGLLPFEMVLRWDLLT